MHSEGKDFLLSIVVIMGYCLGVKDKGEQGDLLGRVLHFTTSKCTARRTHFLFPFTNIFMRPQYYSYSTVNLLAIVYTVSLNSSKLVWSPIKIKVFSKPHFLLDPTKFILFSLNRTLG